MDATITPQELASLIAQPSAAEPHLVIDVRRTDAFRSATDMIQGALRRDSQALATWAGALPRSAQIVVYCVHGHQVSQSAAQALRALGLHARYLDHGIEGWRAHGGCLAAKPAAAATRWVTRARPKIDRIACPWLVARFIDPDAEFLYVPADDVRATAAQRQATPFDIPDAEYGHAGTLCSFDAFIARHRLGGDPALVRLAAIVRGADTGALDLTPQSPGLLAASLGLSRLFSDDHVMLKNGMVLYDALYLWCKKDADAHRSWNPGTGR